MYEYKIDGIDYNNVSFFSKVYSFSISWGLTSRCNYNCSYCNQRKHDTVDKTKEPHPTQATVEQRATKINNFILENKRRTFITMAGGEACLYDLPTIFKIFKDNKYFFGFNLITNGYRNEQYYKDIINVFKETGKVVQLSFSLHEEFINIREFINKITNIKKYAYEQLGKLSYIKCSMVETEKNKEIVDLVRVATKCNNIFLEVQKCVF